MQLALSMLLLASCVAQAPVESETATEPQSKSDGLPPDDVYVVVSPEGHLSVGGERQRYWAVIGKLHASAGVPADATDEQRAAIVQANRDSTDALIARFQALGFNSVRMWDAFTQPTSYEVGDGSRADNVDYFVKQAGEAGFRIWMAGMNRTRDVVPEDASILDEPETAEAWAEAIKEIGASKEKRQLNLRASIAKHWDPRLEALLIQNMSEIATHYNEHTGMRWADDPTFAIWELSNEEWWMRKMVGGQWQKLPAYFRNSLISQWNAFLTEKYGSHDAMLKAWGEVLEGEDLGEGSVLLAPMAGKSNVSASLNDSNAIALEAVKSLEQSYQRSDFPTQRGADVLEFFMGIQLAHKERVTAALRPLGKSTRLSPFIYDTGIGYEAQSQFLHQNADAVAHDAYVNGYGPPLEPLMQEALEVEDPHQRMIKIQGAERVSSNSGPWVNWLLKPPGISQGVPWLEQNRVEGKPYIVYETQIQQPAKYRADFPLRLLSLAAIQDWDWVSWHYFGGGAENRAGQDPEHWTKALDVTVSTHPQGYHFTYDEVQNAMMRAAGNAFTSGSLEPAPNPTVFIYGSKSLYDPDSMEYAGSYGRMGLDMLHTTYQYGVRLQIDPTREDDEVVGPVVSFDDRHTHNPYTPTEQIVFDWKKGYLKQDAPSIKAFTGMLARFGESVEFEDGVTLSDVSIVNPEGIFDPISDDEKYMAFAVYATDGKPLAESKAVSVSLVSTSFNTDYKLGTGKRENPYKPPAGSNKGTLPVLVARVAGTVSAPALNGMTYTMLDWNLKPIGEGTVENGKLTIPSDLPIFVIELNRE